MSTVFGFLREATNLLMAGVMIWVFYDSFKENSRDKKIELLLWGILLGCIALVLK